MTIEKNKNSTMNLYYDKSSIFVNLAKEGNLIALVEYVYNQKSPYINQVLSPEKLARNALMFFTIGNHIKAVEKFFDSPFSFDISRIGILDVINNIIYRDNNILFNLIQEKSKIELSRKEIVDLLLLACSHQATKIIEDLLDKNEELSQQEKLKCFISLINSNHVTDKLSTFQYLETKFNKFLYHQNDDQLLNLLVEKKISNIIDYLMLDKKLRITKHLNILASINLEFGHIVEKRKFYDSINQKMKNMEEQKIEKKEDKKLKI